MAWPTSDRWAQAVRSSHRPTFRAEVWRAGALVAGSQLSVTGGQVTADESSKIRRGLSMTASDVGLMPSQLGDLLSPVDADLHVYRGIRFTEGDVEEVPVGVFRVTRPELTGLRAPLALAADDYAGVLARSRFIKPWVTPAGSLVADEIRRMVQDVLPWVDVLDLGGSTIRTTAATWDLQRWDAIEALADAIGCEMFFDVTGQGVLRRVPTTAGPLAWTFTVDAADADLLDVGQAMSVDGLYNGVVASSSDPNSPVVTATALQRSGPLRWRPGFQIARSYASPLLRTAAQCQQAATAILARSVGYSVLLTPTALPNAALDVGDVVAVQVPRATGTQTYRRVLSGMTLPLDLGQMSVQVRTDADAMSGDLT